MSVDGVLSGKVAVVTGAGRGIGKAISVGYAAGGAAVCCVEEERALCRYPGQPSRGRCFSIRAATLASISSLRGRSTSA